MYRNGRMEYMCVRSWSVFVQFTVATASTTAARATKSHAMSMPCLFFRFSFSFVLFWFRELVQNEFRVPQNQIQNEMKTKVGMGRTQSSQPNAFLLHNVSSIHGQAHKRSEPKNWNWFLIKKKRQKCLPFTAITAAVAAKCEALRLWRPQ